MMRKGLSILGAMVLFSALLTACGGAEPASKGTEQKISTKSNEHVDLVVYSNSGDSEDSWNERFGNALKAKFPNYTIKYIQKQKDYGLPELLTAGQQIDIYWESIGGFIKGLIDNNMQYDMTDLIKKNKVDLNRFEPTVVDAMKQMSGGKMYGLPVFNNNLVMYYNKDLFDKFGVPYPHDGMTWDEANELGAKLTRNDGTQQFVGLSSSGTHMLMMNQLSIPFVDPKTEKSTLFTNERWNKYYEKAFFDAAKSPGYVDFMKAHKNSTPYRNEFLKDRNLAMFGWLSSIIFVFPEDYQKMNWDEVSLPTFSDLPKVGSQSYPTYFSVTNMSKHKDAAMDVITYLTTDEVQTKLSKIGVMPVLKNDSVQKVFGQDSAFKEKNLKAAFYNKFAPIAAKSDYDSLALSPYTHAIADSIISGDVNTTFRKAAEKVDKAISDAKAAK